ncbi:MAG: hypothetical protein WKF37_05430, partial [Bryobacteraceae bacterium]
MVLHADEFRPATLTRDVEHTGELPGEHRRSAKVTNFAAADQIIESFQGFFDRSFVIEAMDLVEVDVIGLETAQAVFDSVHDVLAGQAALVGIVSHGVEDFGGDDDLFPRI